LVNVIAVENLVLKLNKEVFENQIPIEHIHIEVDNPANAWIPGAIGWCYEDDDEDGDFIVVGTTTEFEDEQEFADTVCHELVHSLQIYNGLVVGHETALWDYYLKHCKSKGYNL